jgi:hypothetical protein
VSPITMRSISYPQSPSLSQSHPTAYIPPHHTTPVLSPQQPSLTKPTGNITRQQSAPSPRDLFTPTIKQEVYTTGRGGSGNMVHNDPDRPELARESQDVESPPLRAQQIPHHTGRGMILFSYTHPAIPYHTCVWYGHGHGVHIEWTPANVFCAHFRRRC